MALTARAGQKVKLTCGEALDENGNFTQENFQDRTRHKEGGTARCWSLSAKRGKTTSNPTSPSWLPLRQGRNRRDLTDAVFTAHAVYSDMTVTGKFTCGNDAVNQLVKNSIWSQKATSAISPPTARPANAPAGQGIWRVY